MAGAPPRPPSIGDARPRHGGPAVGPALPLPCISPPASWNRGPGTASADALAPRNWRPAPPAWGHCGTA
eukprot:5540059-Lingulodinium_polyedra.AAC.1